MGENDQKKAAGQQRHSTALAITLIIVGGILLLAPIASDSYRQYLAADQMPFLVGELQTEIRDSATTSRQPTDFEKAALKYVSDHTAPLTDSLGQVQWVYIIFGMAMIVISLVGFRRPIQRITETTNAASKEPYPAAEKANNSGTSLVDRHR